MYLPIPFPSFAFLFLSKGTFLKVEGVAAFSSFYFSERFSFFFFFPPQADFSSTFLKSSSSSLGVVKWIKNKIQAHWIYFYQPISYSHSVHYSSNVTKVVWDLISAHLKCLPKGLKGQFFSDSMYFTVLVLLNEAVQFHLKEGRV